MPFKPGQSGNPNGRPKGVRNKSTETLRQAVSKLLDDNLESIIEDFKKLDPDKRIDKWTRLLDFALPRLQRVESTNTIDVSKLTDDQVNELINKILEE